MNTADQIATYVLQIDALRAEMQQNWTAAQNRIEAHNLDDAISLLNAFFSLKRELEKVESNLESLLHSYFADK
jgi:hypothetical protein